MRMPAITTEPEDRVHQVSRLLAVGGRVVRLEGLRSQPADVVTVIGHGGRRRLTLLVVPPETDPATAEHLLARAGAPGAGPHKKLKIWE